MHALPPDPSAPTLRPPRRWLLLALLAVASAAALLLTAAQPGHADESASGSITGSVTNEQGEPLDGICVHLFRYGFNEENGGPTFETVPRTRDGQFALAPLVDGYYNLTADDCREQPEYRSATYSDEQGRSLIIEIAGGTEVAGVDLTLPRREAENPQQISGVLSLPPALEADEVCVEVHAFSRFSHRTSTATVPVAPGTRQLAYRVELRPGWELADRLYVTADSCGQATYRAAYDAAGGSLDLGAVVAVEPGADDVDFALLPAHPVRARFTTPDGAPVPVCWSLRSVSRDSGLYLSASGRADDGHVEVAGFDGEHSLWIDHCPVGVANVRYVPAWFEFDLPDEGSLGSHALMPGTMLRVEVVEPGGRPLHLLDLDVESEDDDFWGLGVRGGNELRVGPLAAGTYWLGLQAWAYRFELLYWPGGTVTIDPGQADVDVEIELELGSGLRLPDIDGDRCVQLLDGDGTSPDLAPMRFGTLHTGETLLTGVPPGTYDVSLGCADAQTIPDLTLPAGELVDVVTLESAPPAGMGLIGRLPTQEPDGESGDETADDGEEPDSDEPDSDEPDGDDPDASDDEAPDEQDAEEQDPATTSGFEDVAEGSTHADSILRLVDAGITQGCGPSLFCPTNPVTRAQMATFLTRALNLPIPDETIAFTDVDEGDTHAESIQALAAEGITLGCGNGAFCPGEPVTREQMATFLTRALNL